MEAQTLEVHVWYKRRNIVMATTEKQKVVNLRIDEVRRNLIDIAAKLQGKSRTEFMVEAAFDDSRR